jgi:hypothetical protein
MRLYYSRDSEHHWEVSYTRVGESGISGATRLREQPRRFHRATLGTSPNSFSRMTRWRLATAAPEAAMADLVRALRVSTRGNSNHSRYG